MCKLILVSDSSSLLVSDFVLCCVLISFLEHSQASKPHFLAAKIVSTVITEIIGILIGIMFGMLRCSLFLQIYLYLQTICISQ